MNSVNTEDNPFVEFLDDYFAESEEHLASLRRLLLVLEGFVRPGAVNAKVDDNEEASKAIDGLLFALHSLKGLSAMVGIHEAEQLAHAMEESLRAIRQAAFGPTEETVAALAAGTRDLEYVIAFWRKSQQSTQADGAPAEQPPIVVRVDMKRLDQMMAVLGDLVISRGRVEASLRRLEKVMPVSEWRELQDANLLLERQLRDLRKSVMRVRMVPIGQIFERMRFVVRGLERESHKLVQLEMSGGDTEIDKLLVERMIDPLLHLVRNAVSHGLESSEERAASGKTPECHLSLRASTEAETIVIELEDDGCGMDYEQILSRSRALGLIDSETIPGPSLVGAHILQLICAPGFSSREKADLGSGRGVGMTIVKTTVNSLGGSLSLDTQPGKGSRFTIRLPLTLAMLDALIVNLDDQTYAVPRSAIHEVLRVETQEVSKAEDVDVIPCRSGSMPIVQLRRLFHMREKASQSFHVLVAGSGSSVVGIAVDRIAGQREIVVRSVEDPLARSPGIAGATEIGDGRPVLILDVASIVDAARHRKEMMPGVSAAS